MKNYKIITISSIFLLLIIAFLPNVLSEENTKTIYVDDDGTADFISIQDAIDNASDGDTIFVYNGIYYENLIINKSIELIGSNQTTIVANNTIGRLAVVWIAPEAQSDVNFCNFIIKYATKYEYTYGIACESNYSYIVNCKIENCGYGISLSGINNYINNCNFYNNTYGVNVAANFTNVSECYFENNSESGLYIYGSSYCNIKKCNFLKNQNGITIRPIIYYSFMSIPGSTPPLPIYSKGNNIYLCNFIDNEIHATADTFLFSNYWDNGTVGNYWDDYNGTDKNNDGIGDIPYNISGEKCQDMYPLMSPYTGGIVIKDFYVDEGAVIYMLWIAMIATIIFLMPIAYIWYRKTRPRE
jgi:parallel beta-helix repeat protein